MLGRAVSLLAMVRVPDWAPAAVGLNRTVTAVEEPAATLKGGAGVIVKNVFELVIPETFSVAFPVLEIVSGRVTGFPMFTVPKVSGEGETAIAGAAVAVPVPETLTVLAGLAE